MTTTMPAASPVETPLELLCRHARLPGAAELLDSARLSTLLGREVTLDRVRIKPGASVRVSYRATVERPGAMGTDLGDIGWAVLVDSRDKRENLLRRAGRRGITLQEHTPASETSGPFLLSGGLDSDAQLGGEVHRIQHRERGAAPRVLSYNPERHAVLLLPDSGDVLRVAARPLDGLLQVATHWRELGLPTLEQRRWRDRRAVLVGERWGQGDLAALASHPLSMPAATRLGGVMARLHSADLTGRELPEARVGGLVPTATAAIADLLPHRADAVDRLSDRLRDALPAGAPHVLIHGDLSPDQVLVSVDETALPGEGRLPLRVVDLDRSGLGPAGADLGSWMASCLLSGVEEQAAAFLEGYSLRRRLPSVQELAAWTARALLAAALDPMRRHGGDWLPAVEQRLALADAVLQHPERLPLPAAMRTGVTPAAVTPSAVTLSAATPAAATAATGSSTSATAATAATATSTAVTAAMPTAATTTSATSAATPSAAPPAAAPSTAAAPAAATPAVEAGAAGSQAPLVPAQVAHEQRWLMVRRAWADDGRGLPLELEDPAAGPGSARLRAARLDAASGQVTVHPAGTDPRLPGLARVLAAHPDAALVSHRPGKRAVVRTREEDGTVRFVKIVRPGRTDRLLQATARAAEFTGPFRTAQVVAADEDTVTFTEMAGHLLHDGLPVEDGTWRRAWRETLEAWSAAVSRSRARSGAGDTGGAASTGDAGGPEPSAHGAESPLHDAAAEAEVLSAWAERADAVDPEGTRTRRRAVVAATRGLARLGPLESPALLHRDLHDKQILWRPGEPPALLDVDTAALGDPALDAANLRAHATWRALQGLWSEEQADVVREEIDRVAARSGIDPEALAAYESGTIARLACVYAFRPRWRRAARALAATLDRSPAQA
ncbi:phosphotransferase [Brachybacterium sp.]|uniref:phosphotransferase n=1 Tax=Brachybacterium sp. TaxID=1891286 RepID=UPI002ED48C3D